MLISSTSHLTKMMLPFHLLTAKILDGKQIHASSRGITLTMDPIAMAKSSLKLTPKQKLKIWIKQKTKILFSPKRLQKLNQSSGITLLNSKKLSRKFKHTKRSIKLLMRSLTASFQSRMTSPIWMGSISLGQFVTKVPVDLATLSLSLK
jgi:hypothetical protein